MKGQLSNEEFLSMYGRNSSFRKGFDPISKTAWLMYGKSTVNYYIQHEDLSWTNYKCLTIN